MNTAQIDTVPGALAAPHPASFHDLCAMSLDMHLARTGITEDDFAAILADEVGATWTGDDLRRFRTEGYPSTFYDASAYRIGLSGIDAVAFMLQLTPPPHGSCASCVCGVPHSERRHIARIFLADGDGAAKRALDGFRRARGQIREKVCGGEHQASG